MAEITDSAVILSLGAGVQSTTLALMAARGDLSPGFPQPLAAVFADTGWEPATVYRHLHWLIGAIGARLPIHIVRGMRPDGTPAHIREDSEAIVRGDANRLANPPLFVKESIEYTAVVSAPHAHFRSIATLQAVRNGVSALLDTALPL